MAASNFFPVRFNDYSLDATQFHCIRYVGPILSKSSFDKSVNYYLFQNGKGEQKYLTSLAFTWTDTCESHLLLPLWMKKLVADQESTELSFSPISSAFHLQICQRIRLQWFCSGLQPAPALHGFPFHEIIPELLDNRRPLFDGVVLPFMFQGRRYLIEVNCLDEACKKELLFYFDLENGHLELPTLITQCPSHSSSTSGHLNFLLKTAWSRQYGLLQHQLSSSSNSAVIVTGVPYPLQRLFIEKLFSNQSEFRILDLSKFFSEEHFQPSDDEAVATEAVDVHSDAWNVLLAVECISTELMVRILSRHRGQRMIFLTSALGLESSANLIQLERIVHRFDFTLLIHGFEPLGEAEGIAILRLECGEEVVLDDEQWNQYRLLLASLTYSDLLRLGQRYRYELSQRANEDHREADALRLAFGHVRSDSAMMKETRNFLILPRFSVPFPFFGFAEIKRKALQLLSGPLIHSEAYRRLGLPDSAGILVHGPTGCGKTSLVLNMLTDSPMRDLCTVIHVSSASSQLLSKYFGETEANIRALFGRARALRPCVLFLDQIECLGSLRDDDNASSSRYLSTLLNEMDGISGANSGVTVIACANRLEELDDALLRPGRLNHHFFLGPPDHPDCLEIISATLKSFETDRVNQENLEQLADDFEGLSGGEIIANLRKSFSACME